MNIVELVISGGWPTWIIPLVSAFVGWWTNAVAVRMMFEPAEFVGIKPYLGWQGVVPASAMKLAKGSTDLILNKLVSVRQLFADFSPEGMAKELAPALDALTEEVLAEAISHHAGATFSQMAEPARVAIKAMLRAEIEKTAIAILRDVHDDVENIIDLRRTVLEEVARNKQVISDVFLTVGHKEFQFVKLSGLYFGLPLGIVQMLQWVALPIWWTLPVAGFVVGYATNWVAMKLIFHPKKPVKIGPFVLQGLFHKRQHEVAKSYSENVGEKVMSTDNIVRTITTGKSGEILFGIAEKHIGALIDQYAKHPLAAALFPAEGQEALRTELFARLRTELPKPGGFLYQFTTRAMDIQGELFRRMSALDSVSFEGVLRPAFQQDEWKLIVVGGVLGLLAGFVQLVTCFDQVWQAVQF